MKMKNVTTMKNLSAAMVAGILILASCAKNNDVLNSGDTQNVNSESAADSYTSETSDMADVAASAITNTQYNGGRVAGTITINGLGDKDGRLKGANVTITPTGTKDSPVGTIKIDFGTTGTTDANGVVRKGVILILYSGKKNIAQSYRELHYDGYSRNGVAFDNNMVFRNTYLAGTSTQPDSTHFRHALDGGKLTFPSDGTTIVRQANYDVTIDYVAKTLTLSANTVKLHSASGTTRAGKDYTMDINTPLVYKVECLATKVYIAVSGKKTITANKIDYTIDYGDGTCDNTVTITVGGKTATITVNGDGN